MLCRERMQKLIGAINGLSPEIQSPVDELPGKFIDFGVFDNDGPLSKARLAPAYKLAPVKQENRDKLTNEQHS